MAPSGLAPGDADRTSSTAAGRAARDRTPLENLSQFRSLTGRTNPVELLEQQASTRIPELVPIRYGRMLASPFAFLRGAALVMAVDLAAMPHSELRVQLCGDAHLSNFGVFRFTGTPACLRHQRLRRDAARGRSSGT